MDCLTPIFGNLCMLYSAAGNRVERTLELAAAPGPGAPRGLPPSSNYADVTTAATDGATTLTTITDSDSGWLYALRYNVTQAGTMRITIEARNPVRKVIKMVISGTVWQILPAMSSTHV